jgi:hypothetical protein
MKKNKFMKSIIFLIGFYLITNACNAQNSPKIILKYVDLEIVSLGRVNCDNFELLFNSRIKSTEINNNSDIKMISNKLNCLQIDTTNYLPDVRVKIEISSNNEVKVYCLSKFGLCRDNKSYLLPDKLLKIVKKYMK